MEISQLQRYNRGFEDSFDLLISHKESQFPQRPRHQQAIHQVQRVHRSRSIQNQKEAGFS